MYGEMHQSELNAKRILRSLARSLSGHRSRPDPVRLRVESQKHGKAPRGRIRNLVIDELVFLP
jgi:hypothetical protein